MRIIIIFSEKQCVSVVYLLALIPMMRSRRLLLLSNDHVLHHQDASVVFEGKTKNKRESGLNKKKEQTNNALRHIHLAFY